MTRSLFMLLNLLVCCIASGRPVGKNDRWATIGNAAQTLAFNLDNGYFYLLDADGRKVIDYAYFQAGGLQSKEKNAERSFTIADMTDELGSGKCLTVRIAFGHYADILWQAILYDEKDYAVFRMGIDNDSDREYRLTTFYPLISHHCFEGEDNTEGYRILDGTGGGGRTQVSSRPRLTSFNNLMFRFGKPDSLHVWVAGGLTYHEFEKFVRIRKADKRFSVELFSEDPVGRLVAPGERYLPDEKFYLCVNDRNPFDALEKYAEALKTAQQIRLNPYDFPTECLWYASFYNNETGRRKFNDSKGAVEEMDRAVASGITRYTRVAIRLVPDAYGPDNQQGWWDDRHWGMYGEGMSTEGPHYVAPYLTTESWAGAIRSKGGIPITYFQSGRRSNDFARRYPDYMLFNDPYRVMNQPERFLLGVEYSAEYGDEGGYYNHWWTDKMLWSYDFTDPGFIGHMQEVYARLRRAGIAGIMYDYPEVTAWAYEGGFEDRTATTARAYRNMYRLAYDGLGEGAYLDERCLLRGSDLTLGLIASQRVWADTDGITPEMVSRCGLRWYKNRVVVNYDMDAKDPADARPLENADGCRSMLTMCYVTGGRFLLGRSFSQLTEQQLHDLSRTFPYHTTPQSARPVDAFNEGVRYPQIYDFRVDSTWHQLTFYNYRTDTTTGTIAVPLGRSVNEGGLALPATHSYHVYDFWNDRYVGLFRGNDTLRQELRPGEARMMSVRKATGVPQFLSTDRHLMQGYVDMKSCRWNEKKNRLEGESCVIGGEPYVVTIATGGKQPVSGRAAGCRVSFEKVAGPHDLVRLTLTAPQTRTVAWSLSFR